MTSETKKKSALEQIINRAIEQNPQIKDILKSFEPIIVKQNYLMASAIFPKSNYSSIDKEKLKAGVPVCRQINLFLPDDPFKEIVSSLGKAIKAGLPALDEDINRILDLIRKGKINLKDYCLPYPDCDSKLIDRWVEKVKVEREPLVFLINITARVILEARAKEIMADIGPFDWEKGYCPICGDFPSIALIEEEGGKRFLHCSTCGQDWRFTRVTCPYCEKETRKDMEYFYVENKTQEAAFVCDKCKKYLVTLYRAGKLFERDMDVSAMSLIHMDMLMQDKGYTPMTACVWNVLK
ncbi:MAG: formate dehydrogenase accessory protein FdhE [Smithella sp.]|jgi:FdhE protein